jgi:phosphate transport system protein
MSTGTTLEAMLAGLAHDVQRQLAAALVSLADGDLGVADRVIRDEAGINGLRYAVEARVTAELEGDRAQGERLRRLLSTLHVAGELERIADHAEGIAKVTLMLGGNPRPIQVGHSLIDLGSMVEEMLSAGIRIVEDRDEDAARAVCAHDDVIDARYDAVCAEQLAFMAEGLGDVAPRTYLLWVAHNLERIADRVTNICERTVYMVTGAMEDRSVPEGAGRLGRDTPASGGRGHSRTAGNGGRAVAGKQKRSLLPREFDLLVYLSSHPSRALRRAELLAAVWGPRYVGDPGTVDVHMAWLRDKLAGDPGLRITALRGVGYRLDVLPPS